MSRIADAAACAIVFAIVLLPTFTPAGLTRAGEPPRRSCGTVVVTRRVRAPHPPPARPWELFSRHQSSGSEGVTQPAAVIRR